MREWFNHEEEGVWYTALVLEFCVGGSIDYLIDDDNMMDLDYFDLLLLIAKGVQHLHQHHVIHRDLKPDNVLTSRGKPKISDLGTAKIVTDPN